jgi:hypothetical protein
MNPIKARLERFLEGGETAAMFVAERFLPILPEIVEMGRQNNGDAIVYGMKSKKDLLVVAVVGKSVLQGEEMSKYLEVYFGDAGGMKIHKVRLRDELYEGLRAQPKAMVFLKSDDNKWRSFMPMKSVDEVYGAVGVN